MVCEILAMKYANLTIAPKSLKRMLVSIRVRNSQRLIIKKKIVMQGKKMTKSFARQSKLINEG